MCRALSCGRGLSGNRVRAFLLCGAAFLWGDKLMNPFWQEDLLRTHEAKPLCLSGLQLY